MSINSLESCCSILEVHNLYGNVTAEEIKKEFDLKSKTAVAEDIMESILNLK